MGNAKYFDENVIAYDRYRPTYGTDIFNDIINFAKISTESKILEIGCGTGNATLPFIKTNADVTAVELGENLSHYTAQKFNGYNNFLIYNTSFEKFETTIKYDLIVSATAFHWIKNDFGYSRCHDLLKDNGVLAVFWNTPRISADNYELKAKIRQLYEQYLPDEAEEIESLTDSKWYQKRCEGLNLYLEQYGYNDRIFKLYYENRIFTANEYVGLLHTYSNHMVLPDDVRNEFFQKVHSTISAYGTICIKDTIDLHMGRV